MKLRSIRSDESTPHARTLQRRRLQWLREPNFDDRINDAVGPVLGRDVQQALNARITSVVFMVSGGLLLHRFLPAGRAALESHSDIPANDHTIMDCWAVLLFVLWCAVPIRAFLRAREDVAAPIVEQLALCDLRPIAIARDKLFGSLLLAIALGGMFAPILAFQAALGSVSVRTALAAGFVTFAGTVIGVSIALAAASLCRNPMLRSVALAGTAIAVLVPTLAVVPHVREGLRWLARHLVESPWMLWVDVAVATAAVSGVALCIAARAYAHTRDHIEVELRRLGLLVPLVFVALALLPGSLFSNAPAWLPLALVAPFWWWALATDSGGARYALVSIGLATLAGSALAVGRQYDVIVILALQSLALAGCLGLLRSRPTSAARAHHWLGGVMAAVLALPWLLNAARGQSLFRPSAVDMFQPFAAHRALLQDGVFAHPIGTSVLALLAALAWAGVWRAAARREVTA